MRGPWLLIGFCMASLLLFAPCLKTEPQNGELTGDILIATEGGKNIQLGLVGVSIIPGTAIRPYLLKKLDSSNRMCEALKPRAQLLSHQLLSLINSIPSPYDEQFQTKIDAHTELFDRTKKELADLCALQGYLLSMAYYFNELPPNIAQTYTDYDGHFVVSLPRNGWFALAAHATRAIGDTTEEYYWLVRVSLRGAATGKITLSKDNLATTAQSLEPLIMPGNRRK